MPMNLSMLDVMPPTYLSSTPSSCKRLCDVEVESLEQAIKLSLQESKEQTERNSIKTIDDLINHIEIVKRKILPR